MNLIKKNIVKTNPIKANITPIVSPKALYPSERIGQQFEQ
jgi:hypothetical protein